MSDITAARKPCASVARTRTVAPNAASAARCDYVIDRVAKMRQIRCEPVKIA
jgi:hypothetical protein